MSKTNHKLIEKANLEVESAFSVFRKAQAKVLSAVSKLEDVVSKSKVNIDNLNAKIREEEEVVSKANGHIEVHKDTLEKFSKFLP